MKFVWKGTCSNHLSLHYKKAFFGWARTSEVGETSFLGTASLPIKKLILQTAIPNSATKAIQTKKAALIPRRRSFRYHTSSRYCFGQFLQLACMRTSSLVVPKPCVVFLNDMSEGIQQADIHFGLIFWKDSE